MMESITRPVSEQSAVATQGQGTRPDLMSNIAAVDVAAVQSGIATKYWLELLAYPPGSARSLWLLVNNSWKSLDNPNASTSDVVQRAFLGTGSNVRVWFDGNKIVGLVVEGS